MKNRCDLCVFKCAESGVRDGFTYHPESPLGAAESLQSQTMEYTLIHIQAGRFVLHCVVLSQIHSDCKINFASTLS